MPRQAPGHRMNTKANFDTPCRSFSAFLLPDTAPAHRHTEPW
ncbi:hypothetical protein ACLFLT_23590 [Klebsiella pneumoniae]